MRISRRLVVTVVKEVIEEFGSISGLQPNYNKSTIIFGSVHEDIQKDILEVLPFKVEKLPVRYLGVPLITKRIGVKECKCLIDKVRNRVLNRKNKCLSYAGRLQLVASILESIHVYWATVFLLPQTVINDINRLLKGFHWNQGEQADGKAKVAWKNLCKPKVKGGLGLKNLSVWNQAMITKHLWYIAVDKDSLWVKWVNTFKLKGRSIWEISEEANDSWGWRNILRMRQGVRAHMVKKLGNGTSTSMWFDNWSGIGAINAYITYRDLYDEIFKADMTVREFVEISNGRWPNAWITNLPVNDVSHNIVLNDEQQDKLMWNNCEGVVGKFSVKQVYKDLLYTGDAVSWSKLVWFSQNIPKYAFILWLAIQGKLTTHDRIRKWGSYDLMVCSLCYEEMDSHDHLFFKCKFSNGMWSKVLEKIHGMQWADMGWRDLIGQFSNMYNGT